VVDPPPFLTVETSKNSSSSHVNRRYMSQPGGLPNAARAGRLFTRCRLITPLAHRLHLYACPAPRLACFRECSIIELAQRLRLLERGAVGPACTARPAPTPPALSRTSLTCLHKVCPVLMFERWPSSPISTDSAEIEDFFSARYWPSRLPWQACLASLIHVEIACRPEIAQRLRLFRKGLLGQACSE
jgi:hypothetical protein